MVGRANSSYYFAIVNLNERIPTDSIPVKDEKFFVDEEEIVEQPKLDNFTVVYLKNPTLGFAVSGLAAA